MAFDYKKTKQQVKAHLAKRFLFILREEDTFEEVASYKLTLLNVYLLLSTVVFAVGFLLLLLLIATPLKTFIPGYGNVRSTAEYIYLEKKIESLEQEMAAREVYINSIKRVLTGNPQTSSDVTKDVSIRQEAAVPVPRIKEDSLLRVAYEDNKSAIIRQPSNPLRTVRSQPVTNVDLSEMRFLPPLRGTLGANYKPEKDHFGIDIIAPENTPIRAVMSGSIIQSDWTLENGHTISIQHSNNLISVYKHNSALLKKTGTHVKAGEAIAIIGNTGRLTEGPHLHFELWYMGNPVNPLNYIDF
ncbi:MAG: M23 family metallopeptidase [Saprospiraceae bacterium]|nr:M23 family metallopeptidase [Candidatus Vicinibacter affinis]